MTLTKNEVAEMRKTPYERERDARDRKLWKEWTVNLAKHPEVKKTYLMEALKKEAGLYSTSAFYAALKRGQQLTEGAEP